MHRDDGAVFRITFRVPGRWSSERYTKQRNRAAAGSTSIRVSRATLRAVRELAHKVSELHHDSYSHYRLSPDELLSLVLAGGLAVRDDRPRRRSPESAFPDVGADARRRA